MLNRQEIKFQIRWFLKTGGHFIQKLTNGILFTLSLSTLLLLIYEFGFRNTPESQESIKHFLNIALYTFFIIACIRIVINPKEFKRRQGFWFKLILFICLTATVLIISSDFGLLQLISLEVEDILKHFLLITISLIRLSKDIVSTLQRYIKPEMMFVYSFLTLVVIGSFLLMLPTAHHGELGFINALFTSTSAVCITGLSVIDIATTFTFTGQVILICLIQVGGIGVMTFTSFLAMSFFSRFSFQNQLALKEMISENSLNNVFRTLIYILLTTLIVEAFGAIAIYQQISHLPSNIIPNKIFFSVFHSISAFCNAGFTTLHDSLNNPAVKNMLGLQTVFACIIITGGIGFPIVFNFGRLFKYHIKNIINRLRGYPVLFERKYHIVNLTTRIAILSSIILIISGAILFWIFENNNTLQDMSFSRKLATSFFAAVTPRSGGFNNVDMEALLPPAIYMTIILMWIGASPMSTGGGIKTTTFAVAALNVLNTIKGKGRVEICKREISPSTVNKANAVIILSIIWNSLIIIILTILEPNLTVTQAMFEVFSASSTTGLSLNVTPELKDISKIVIAITMFTGRIGLFTILTGFIRQQHTAAYTYPEEEVIL